MRAAKRSLLNSGVCCRQNDSHIAWHWLASCSEEKNRY